MDHDEDLFAFVDRVGEATQAREEYLRSAQYNGHYSRDEAWDDPRLTYTSRTSHAPHRPFQSGIESQARHFERAGNEESYHNVAPRHNFSPSDGVTDWQGHLFPGQRRSHNSPVLQPRPATLDPSLSAFDSSGTFVSGLTSRAIGQYAYSEPHPLPQDSPPCFSQVPATAHMQDQRAVGPRTSEISRASNRDLGLTQSGKRGQHDGPQTQPPTRVAGFVQGIQLRSVHEVSDRFRSIFPFPNFNAIQSKCFPIAFNSDDNFVLLAPTGSGKTVIFELAILRLINTFQSGEFKIVYQAPTKSLCAERKRDWEARFRTVGLSCAELTGDTDASELRSVQSASIIVTTPEKWDSITRKWKDHARLMKMIKLFLVDEVHMVHEERGATLEAVVSRMKSIQSKVRFVAVSATVPNAEDIAAWLGRDHLNQHEPAQLARFGEEFRPVQLRKHVIGYAGNGNEFAFDKALDAKIPELITQYSHRKPIMIFCFTRKSCESTASSLAAWWSSKRGKDQFWNAPKRTVTLRDKNLQKCASTGVVWHHAGVEFSDRLAIEKGYLNGEVSVICCTSTLAVGVNLPCHLAIIKNTVFYAGQVGLKEYSDLEIMQMLGRAGRPQFDDNAIAIIMTRREKIHRYEKLVSGEEVIESCLHKNLIDHLNAEIGLGTVVDLSTAKKWLRGTFLWIRLQQNPQHYRLDDGNANGSLDARLEDICCRDLDLLRGHNLVEGDALIKSTVFGESMARFCVRFETARVFLALPEKSKVSELLSAIAMAQEYQDVRFRAAEKSCYKSLNASAHIKFPIPVTLDSYSHKVSLVIQSQLAGTELPTDEGSRQHLFQYHTDTAVIFQHISRLIRCIIDFKIAVGDSVSIRNALFLHRSVAARCWDDSPLRLKQLENIGPVAVRKLIQVGLQNIEMIEHAEASRIEHVVTRNPPFGKNVIESARAFPKLRVSIEAVGKPVVKQGVGAKINLRAEIGFLNDQPPMMFNKKPVFVVFLAETSDGKSLHFARASAKKIGNGQHLRFSADLIHAAQFITCYVMCDEFAGTCASATLKPTIPSIAWPVERPQRPDQEHQGAVRPRMNSAKRRHESVKGFANTQACASDEFGDLLDDDDLVGALAENNSKEYMDIDEIEQITSATRSRQAVKPTIPILTLATTKSIVLQPSKRPDGRYTCNHRCKDKQTCQHLCCREGLDHPPRPSKRKSSTTDETSKNLSRNHASSVLQKNQATLYVPQNLDRKCPFSMDSDIDFMDLSAEATMSASKAPSRLADLQLRGYKGVGPVRSTQKDDGPWVREHPQQLTQQGIPRNLSSLPSATLDTHAEEYGDDLLDSELPNIYEIMDKKTGRFERDSEIAAKLMKTKAQTSEWAPEVPHMHDSHRNSAAGQALDDLYDVPDLLEYNPEYEAAGSERNSHTIDGSRSEHASTSTTSIPRSRSKKRPHSAAYHNAESGTESPIFCTTKAPFFETSSSTGILAMPSADDHRPGQKSGIDLTGDDNNFKKRQRTEPPLEPQPMSSAEVDSVGEVEPWIIAEFGMYVDLV